MDHTLGYLVGRGCGTGTCRHGGTHHCMDTTTEAVCVNSLTGCETTADGVPKHLGRSMSVQ